MEHVTSADVDDPHEVEQNKSRTRTIYSIPFCGESISRQKWARYVPFCPGYGDTQDSDEKATNQLVTIDVKEGNRTTNL